MVKMVALYGVSVVIQKHPQPRRRLPGILAGAMEVTEEETPEAGANSQGVVGESSTLKRHRVAGIPPVPLPRIYRLVLGAGL